MVGTGGTSGKLEVPSEPDAERRVPKRLQVDTELLAEQLPRKLTFDLLDSITQVSKVGLLPLLWSHRLMTSSNNCHYLINLFTSSHSILIIIPDRGLLRVVILELLDLIC